MSMRLPVCRWVLFWTAAAAAVLLAAPTGAQANGPCGQNANGNSACPLAIPSTVSGSLVTSNESDYYVFSGQAGQEIFATITDTEAPSCSAFSSTNHCGSVQAGLYDASGNSIYGAQTGSSEPNNGLTVPQSFAWTVQASGTYYLIVSGGLGTNANGNPTPVPYTLAASAQPSPCGYSFQTAACAVNSPATPTGRLQTGNQADYYAMFVQPNTELSVTVTDTETPTCSAFSSTNRCGYVQAGLYDASGNSIYDAQTGSSEPNNGITVPQSFSYTVSAGGVYFIEVSGGLGSDANQNPTPVPYALAVSASPNVTWPPPGSPAPVAPTAPKPKPTARAPKLQVGAVHHTGHTVSLTVKLASGVGEMTATATSGKRHRTVRVRHDGRSYTLTAHLAPGTWVIHVKFIGATGWLTGTLRVRVHVT